MKNESKLNSMQTDLLAVENQVQQLFQRMNVKESDDVSVQVQQIFQQLKQQQQEQKAKLEELDALKSTLNQHAIVSFTDAQGNITYANENFCQTSGYDLEELIGRNHRILKSNQHNDDFYKELWNTISNNKIWQGVVCNINKQGKKYWVKATIAPVLDEQGKPIQYISIRTEITKLKKIKDKLDKKNKLAEMAMDLTKSAYWQMPLDNSGEYISSKRKVKLLGDPKRKKKRYRTIEDWAVNIDAVNPSLTQSLFQVVEDVKNGVREQLDFTYPYKRPIDGKVIWVRSLGYLVKGGNNKCDMIYGVSQNITQAKKAELKLAKATKVAKKANKAKGDFLANISHEIRTPMNAIIGLSHLTLKTDLSDKQRDNIAKVHSAANNLLGMMNEILDFSKIEAGKLELDYVSFNLQSVIEQLKSIVCYLIKEKGLQLDVVIDPKISDGLYGDPFRLGQVLINLVNNAIKFTEIGKIAIHISELQSSDENINLCFEVIDSGIGLSKSQQEKLFKPFSQADGSTTRQYGGTGLGLNICKQLVELMGGKIGVDSELDKGSTFYFNVKFQPVAQHVAEELSLENIELQDQLNLTKLRGSRILLVEDNEVNQQIAQELLISENIFVSTANNGLEALEKLQQEQFDGVLMDLQMPVMDGYIATQKIRKLKKYKKLPIIAMSANSMDTDIAKCFNLGMDDHITKPINPRIFYATLAKWIDLTIKNVVETDLSLKSQLLNSNKQLDFSLLQGIDVEDGLQRVLANKELYFATLKSFATTYSDIIDKLVELMKLGNLNHAIQLLHKLIAVAGNIGANELKIIAQRCEFLLKQDKRIDTNIPELEQEFERVINSITSLTELVEEKLDKADLNLLLSELKAHLASNDLRANNSIDKLLNTQLDEQFLSQMVKVKKLVSKYEFERAYTVFESQLKYLGIDTVE